MNSDKPDSAPADAYSKLSDTIDGKILDFNLKILALFASLLIKPLALATEPFFRKNFGERYFTGMGCFISIALWNLVQNESNAAHSFSGSPLEQLLLNAHLESTAHWFQAHNIPGRVAYLVSFAYGFLAWQNYARIKIRHQKGQHWYTMSRGESIFGSENKTRDIIIAFVALDVLGSVCPALGLFFFLSQCASYYLAAKAESSFYSRYLDIQDAKLENEFMQRCLDRGEPPTNFEGLYYSLPKSIQGENRTRVARVVATTQFAPGTTGVGPQTPKVQPQSGTASTNDPKTFSLLIFQLKELLPLIASFLRMLWLPIPLIAKLVSSKRFIRFAPVGLAIILCCWVGTSLIKSYREHRNSALAPEAEEKQNAPPTSRTTPLATRVAAVQNQEPESFPAVDAPPKPIIHPTAPSINAAAQAAAMAQAALEKAALEKAKSHAREKYIEQINTLITTETDQLAKFKASCESALSNNTNRIKGVAYSSRTELAKEIAAIQLSADSIILGQEHAIVNFKQREQPYLENPQSDFPTFLQKLQKVTSEMDADRQRISDQLNQLDTDISAAPARKRFGLF